MVYITQYKHRNNAGNGIYNTIPTQQQSREWYNDITQYKQRNNAGNGIYNTIQTQKQRREWYI